MGIPKTGFHELIQIWGIYPPPPLRWTHTHACSVQSCSRVSLELHKPRKRYECKNTHRLTHPHTHSLQFSSARASPFCPHCLMWSYSAAWTQHVSWKDGRSKLTHCGPLLTNHHYHTALRGYQRENTGQPFAQTRGLTNNLLTCWEFFLNYSQPYWLHISADNLSQKIANWLEFCVTPVMQLYRNWRQSHPANLNPQITAPIFDHFN